MCIMFLLGYLSDPLVGYQVTVAGFLWPVAASPRGGTECNLVCSSARNHATDIPNLILLPGLEKISVRCKDHSVNRMYSD